MSNGREDLGQRAAALRSAFDRAFAEAPDPGTTPALELLAIGVGNEPYALRLSEAGGVFRDRPVTRLPTALRALAGVAGFRGTLLPVYSLGVLLGHDSPAIGRWLVSVSGRVALAFDRFDGLLRAAPAELSDARSDRVLCGIVRSGGIARPVIDLTSILESIAEQANVIARGRSSDDE